MAEFFAAEHLPRRITLGIEAIKEGVLIEASAIVARPTGRAAVTSG